MRALPLVLPLLFLPATGCIGPADEPDVVLIPFMRERPVLDKELGHAEWADARVLDGEFVIADGTLANGTYPMRLRIGADKDVLHIAIELPGLPPNPHSVHEPGANKWYPDDMMLYFMMGHEGALAPPADMIRMWYMPDVGSGTDDGYWNGHEWVYQPEGGHGSGFNDGLPPGRWGRGGMTENGTVFWELHMPRISPNDAHDDFQLGPHADFRMALLFHRQGDWEEGSKDLSPDARGLLKHPHDVWPGPAYTPHDHYDPATWLKLRVGA